MLMQARISHRLRISSPTLADTVRKTCVFRHRKLRVRPYRAGDVAILPEKNLKGKSTAEHRLAAPAA
jgi:hypothetical protein